MWEKSNKINEKKTINIYTHVDFYDSWYSMVARESKNARSIDGKKNWI